MLIDIMDKNIEIKTYDYYAAVKADVIDYINENYNVADFKNMSDDEIDEIRDEIFNLDCITGNASGSYWFSTWKAEKALFGNSDLLMEAIEQFEYQITNDTYAESLDVLIRCYIVDEVFYNAIEELIEDK